MKANTPLKKIPVSRLACLLFFAVLASGCASTKQPLEIFFIGKVSAYLVPHHGEADSADPATFGAFQPRIAILNNGAIKGGHPDIFDLLRSLEGLEDVWQLDRSESPGAVNIEPDRIANLGPETSHWLKLTAHRDGSFEMTNSRTGDTVKYKELQ